MSFQSASSAPPNLADACAITRLLNWYATLSPSTLADIHLYYTDDAYFKDPFNEFRAREPIRVTYQHMFNTFEHPRFHIIHAVKEHPHAVAQWQMTFRWRSQDQRINGCTHFIFAADGRVQSHRDYWDAAEEFYEKLPLLGAVLRALKKRVQTPLPNTTQDPC